MIEPNRPAPFTANRSSAEGGRRDHVERSAEGGRRDHVERSAEGGRRDHDDAGRATRPALSRLRAMAVGSALALLSGCGSTVYAIDANSAASKLAEAEELGAERYAPYEYYMANEHLTKAKSEAAEADYSDAAALADAAEEYADKAIELAREAHRGAGR